MTKKFIDADVLFKTITDNHYFVVSKYNSVDYGMFTTGIKQVIDEMTAADVQEVVRCKDCKYLNSNEFCEGNHPDFYCADGEKNDCGVRMGGEEE